MHLSVAEINQHGDASKNKPVRRTCRRNNFMSRSGEITALSVVACLRKMRTPRQTGSRFDSGV
jgi:hypothetical protein